MQATLPPDGPSPRPLPLSTGHGGSPVYVDRAMDAIGQGRFHAELFVACGLGFAAVAVEIVTLAFILPELQDQWGLSDKKLALLPTFLGIGSCLGGPFWGMAADSYGRRAVFMVTLILVVVFGILSATSANLAMLIVLRGGVSFGIGGAISVDFTVFSELSPTAWRSSMLMCMAGFWPLGSTSGALLAWYVLPNYGWRAFLVCGSLPSALGLCLRPWIPESPRWLLLQGRSEEAKQVLIDIAVRNRLVPEDVCLGPGVQLVLHEDSSPRHSKTNPRSRRRKTCSVETELEHPEESSPKPGLIAESWQSIRDIFSPSWWRTSVGLIAMGLGAHAAGYALITIMPTMLERKGLPPDSRYRVMLFSAMAKWPAVFLCVFLHRLAGGCLKMLKVVLLPVVVALLIFLHTTDERIVILCSVVGSFALECVWLLLQPYQTEVFPTEVRATAVGTIIGMTFVLTMPLPMATAFCLTIGLTPAVLFLAGTATVASIVVALSLHIEVDGVDLRDTVAQLTARGSSNASARGVTEPPGYGAAGSADDPSPAA